MGGYVSFSAWGTSATSDASVTVANFYHVGQGSRSQLSGTSLATASSQYDIGAVGNKWKASYINNVYCSTSVDSSSGNLWQLVTSVVLDDTASAIDLQFTAMSYIDNMRMIFTGWKEARDTLFLYFNTATSGYSNFYLGSESGGSYYSSIAATNIIPGGVEPVVVFKCDFQCETGPNRRSFICDILSSDAALTTNAMWIERNTISFFDSATEVNSLRIRTNDKFRSLTSVQLWGRK